jgi:hypothetical protein
LTQDLYGASPELGELIEKEHPMIG